MQVQKCKNPVECRRGLRLWHVRKWLLLVFLLSDLLTEGIEEFVEIAGIGEMRERTDTHPSPVTVDPEHKQSQRYCEDHVEYGQVQACTHEPTGQMC